MILCTQLRKSKKSVSRLSIKSDFFNQWVGTMEELRQLIEGQIYRKSKTCGNRAPPDEFPKKIKVRTCIKNFKFVFFAIEKPQVKIHGNVMNKFLTVFCTLPDANIAGKMAETLVGEKLAACCNIVPNITSVYTWQGQVQRDSEVLMIIKTTHENYGPLEKRILELHPYEVPEIIALNIEKGSASYLNWINRVVKND